jgi:hypothetical protein
MEHLDSDAAQKFIGGALDTVALSYWSAHLAACAPCRELVARERSLAGLLKLDEDFPRSAGALQRVLSCVSDAAAPPSRARRFRRAAPSIAMAIVLGAALGFAYRLTTAPTGHSAEDSLAAPAERRVIENLDILETLQRAPWLAENYETVRWFEKLVAEQRGG